MSDKPKAMKLQLWLMAGMLTAVIVAGFLVFPKTQEERDALLAKLGTTNHGDFIQPTRDIAELPLLTLEGEQWRYDNQKIKWRYLIADDGRCQQACRDMLYLTRQVHIRVGKNSQRLERLYLLLGDELAPDVKAFLENEHHYLRIIKTSTGDYNRWLSDSDIQWAEGSARALLVDQAGQAMMYYTPEHDGNGLLEDINHLLKYSPAP